MRSVDPFLFAMMAPLLMALMSLLCLAMWRSQFRRSYLVWMAANQALIGLALSIQLLSRSTHAYISSTLAVSLYLLSAICLSQALHRRLAVKANLRPKLAIATIGTALSAYFLHVQPNLLACIITLSTSLGCILMCGLPKLWAAPKRQNLDRWALGIYVLIIVTALCRPLALIGQAAAGSEVMPAHSLLWWGTLVIMLTTSVLLPICLMGATLFDAMSTLKHERNVDTLTGAINRRALQEKWVSRPLLQGERTLILCDLDHFKQINDQHGHAVGDAVLRKFTEALLLHLRQGDTVARIGGEEFVIVLWQHHIQAALDLIQRLRQNVLSRIEWHEGKDGPIQVTASWGVIRIQPEETLDQALQRADAYLYEAKHRGRDLVCSETI